VDYNFLKYETESYIDFYNVIPVQYDDFIFYVEKELTGNYLTKLFRYSTDNVNWSLWIEFNEVNLTKVNTNVPCYIQIRYEKDSRYAGSVSRLDIWLHVNSLGHAIITEALINKLNKL
jgi:hypothetical protein